MARGLVQTPGFYWTSIPGIGVVLAAHIMGEYGCPDRWPPADNMASYGGIVPRQKQTGGSDSPPKVGHLPLDANHILKDYLLQAAYHAGTTGEHRLQQHYQRVEHRDGKSRLSTAKLLVRIGRRLALTESVYLPAEILQSTAPLPPGYVAAYYQQVSAQLQTKWKSYDLSGIDPQANRLRQWQETVSDIVRFTTQTV